MTLSEEPLIQQNKEHQGSWIESFHDNSLPHENYWERHAALTNPNPNTGKTKTQEKQQEPQQETTFDFWPFASKHQQATKVIQLQKTNNQNNTKLWKQLHKQEQPRQI